MTIRPSHPSDLPSLYEICHRTGHVGRDASEVLSDRTSLGHYFAAPYVIRNPEWCWVVTDHEGVAGYLVTTPDSRGFAAWMNDFWLPGVRDHYKNPLPSEKSPFEGWLRQTIVGPASVPDFVDTYPAHLHIDLLPRGQGQGWGGRLLATFVAKLHQGGIPGFHLGVGTENVSAQGFYAKQGFQVIRRDPGVVYFGLCW